MNLVLCGMPRAGKTTVGQLLSSQLAWDFVDTDHLIETAYQSENNKKLSCREIYIKEGPDFFRSLEEEQVESLHAFQNSVIVLGGGVPLSYRNRQTAKNLGKVIFLDLSIDLLWQRMQFSLPAFLDSAFPFQDLDRIIKERRPFYQEIAHRVIVADGLSAEEITGRIVDGQ